MRRTDEKQQDWLTGLQLREEASRRRRAAAVRATQLLLLLLFIGGWEVAGRLAWIDTLLFSYPSRIVRYLREMLVEGTLLHHTGLTVLETMTGFMLGTLAGTVLAALLWWFPFAARVCDPFLVVLNSMPKIALGPIFIVALGPGLLAIVAITLSVTVIITTLVIYTRFREVDDHYVKVVTLLGGSRRQVFRYVIVPDAFPAMISALKVNVGLAWIGVIVGEFLVAQAGLGYMIIYGFQVFNFTLVLGSLSLIALLAFMMYQGVSWLERRLTSGHQQR